MNVDTFFTDHWAEIEDERVARYEQMFVWRDAQRALLQPAGLEPGHDVLDLGCGPGFFAMALGDMVAPGGTVTGADLNARFVADATERAAALDAVSFRHVTDHNLPFDDGSFDRAICKNVLEYVPDLDATLGELLRVTRPGGKVHVIDSDWGFVIVEPWGKATVDRFFEAAAPAFREPYIGRKAAGALLSAGFSDVDVRLVSFVDRQGNGLNVLTNMVSYIKTFGTLPDDEADGLLASARDAVTDGRFLFCLPQFLVTATR